jgi:hypothetical protein
MQPSLDLFTSAAVAVPARCNSRLSHPSDRASCDDRQRAAAALQAVLSDIFLNEEPARALLAVAPLVPKAHQSAWHLLTHTLLARRLELGSPLHLQRAASAHTRAWAWARQWEKGPVPQRWQRLLATMTARQCSQLAARAASGLRRLGAVH